ncbi:uncharacterized protein LOC126840793 [Adelges cooleyi]|uniref:uncharacterized protein LOC126840793 n=1 Tax=Adelges cooleyi TaxID=133065 RepID=UPI00217F7F9C|nr:uncharacterized protein LOC126840793 [Adelges cooleyi]
MFIVQDNSHSTIANMNSKLFLNFLVAFLANIPLRIILAQDDAALKLNELMKNPVWISLKTEKIIDDDTIWRIIEQQQSSDHKIQVSWSGEPKEISDVLHEVASQYGTKKLATLQKLTLQSVTQMFYEKILVAVQIKFSDIKYKIYEGICPPNFFTVLRNNWEELKNVHFPAIREACLSIRYSNSEEDCQETFYKSLKRKWLNFINIDRPAIAAACFSVISPAKEMLRQFGVWTSLNKLLQSIHLFVFQPPTAITDGLPLKRNEFWDLLKDEIMKFLTVEWRSETTETLETLNFYLENQHIVDPIEVVKLLELELKTSVVDFDDKEVSLYNETPLEIVNNFTEEIVNVRESINNVSLSNALLWNAFGFEDSIMIEPAKELDDSAVVNKLCQLLAKVIKLFDLMIHHINVYNHDKIDAKETVLKRLLFGFDELKLRLPKLVKLVSYYLSNAPRAENVYIRNALVLMCMYKVSTTYPIDDNMHDGFRQPSQLNRLALLITIQLENYIVWNCGVKEYTRAIINSQIYSLPDILSQNTIGQIFKDIDNAIRAMQPIRVRQTLIDNECDVNLSKASFERLVDYDFSPLNCIVVLQIQWDGAYKTIQAIREEVVFSMNPKKFAVYQGLVQNCVTSIFLGYILNILRSAGQNEVNFTDDQISSILDKFKQFEGIVYPYLKVDSPKYIFNILVWCFKQNKISDVKANILKDKIERKIKSYGLNMSNYYSVLKSNNIISDVHASGDVQETYIEPLKVFVEQWVAKFKNDFYCVANYMKLII